jgi:hypothetical protein
MKDSLEYLQDLLLGDLVMRNLCSFQLDVNFEVFILDNFGPHIPAAALPLLHVTQCML